jgi:hypothetical protein
MLIGLAVDAAVRGPDLVSSLAKCGFPDFGDSSQRHAWSPYQRNASEPPFTKQDVTWDRTRVAAEDCPRISKEFLAEELKELGALRFSEEYSLEFVDDDTAVFPSAIIAAAFTNEVTPLWQ